MSIYHAAIVFIWAVFLVVWIVTAANIKQGRGGWGGMLWRVAIIVAILAIFQGPLSNRLSAYHFAPLQSPALALAGDIIAALGIAFAIWARLHLGRNWGMPMSEQEGSELVVSGPYAYVRHPIYAGVILALIGTALLLGPLWLALPLSYAGYFAYSALQEEKRMVREFPDAYPAYRARTKFLIPFVW